MAAAVKQHHITGLGLFQAVQQAVEIQCVVGGVVVGVPGLPGPTALKTFLWFGQLGLLIQMRFGAGLVGDKVRRHAQATGAAWRLLVRRATIGDDRASLPNNSTLCSWQTPGCLPMPR